MRVFFHLNNKLVLLLSGLLTCLPSMSLASMNLSGSWIYRDSKNDSDSISEEYSASLGKDIHFTEIMDMDLGVRVSRNKTESRINDIYSPTLGYHLTNDVFVFNLDGFASKTQNSEGADPLMKGVSALWNSAWKAKGLIPSLSLNYHQNWQEDELSPHLSDSSSANSSTVLNWDFGHSKLYYNFTTQENENYVGDSRSNSANHSARFSTGAKFWGQKGTASFTSKYSYSESEDDLPVVGGVAILALNVTAYSAEVTGTNFSLIGNGALTNSLDDDVALSTDNDLNDYLTIAVRVNPSQQVHRLYLYIDSDENLSITDAAKFSWDVYTSSDNTFWALREVGAVSSYNALEKRFEIDVNPYLADYISVRATSDAGAEIVNFSEIEAYQEIAASGDRTILKRDQTVIANHLDTAVQLRPDLKLTANLSMVHNAYSAGSDSDETNVGAGAFWSPKENWNVRLNSSLRINKNDGAEELQDRNYGLSFSVPPLKTVDTIYSVTLKEKYRGSQKTSVVTSYNFQALAEVYTDLDARYSASYTDTANKEDQQESSSTSSGLSFTARLVPGLVVNWANQYAKSSDQAANYSSKLDANWRISDLLSLTSGGNQVWTQGGDSTSVYLNVNVALSSNMQLSFNQNYKIKPTSQYDSSLSWQWTINRYVSLLTSGAYRHQDLGEEDWRFLSYLNASFTAN